MKVVENAGDSENIKPGQIISARQLRDENSLLRRNDQNLVEARDAKPATAEQVLYFQNLQHFLQPSLRI